MQFRLMTLLILMSVISVGCALLFVAPAMISIPVLASLLWISPSFWVAGVIYARGYRQAFFVGGLVAAAIPFLAVGSYSMTLAFQWVQVVSSNSMARPRTTSFFNNEGTVTTGLLLLSPFVFSTIGGAVAVFVRMISLPDASPKVTRSAVPLPRPHALDEVVDPALEPAIEFMRRRDETPPHEWR